jgi:hypothetical protein
LIEQAERLPLDSPERTSMYQQMQAAVLNDETLEAVLLWRQNIGLGGDMARNDPLHPIYGLPMLESAWVMQP